MPFQAIERLFSMKTLNYYIIGAVTLLLCIAIPLAAQAKKKEARIDFQEETYDFGKVPVGGGNVSHEFHFINSGDANLVIIDAKADCGCTRPVYSEEPVAPGKSGKIKVTFVPNGKGHFTKKVTITTNGKPRKARLIIKGEVVR